MLASIIVNELTKKRGGHLVNVTKEDRRNAFLYCKFRHEQYVLYDAYAKSHGLLMNTFLVLNVLFYAKDGMTQKAICEQTLQSKQTVSLIIKRLEKDGHVALHEDPADKRNKIVCMTEAGRAFSEEPVRHITCSEDTAMSLLSPEEQEQLIALSRKFTAHLTRLVKGED